MGHRELAGRFNARIGRRWRTLLVGGAPEPLYLPERGRRPALIHYTRDHAGSALHEIAHWLIASPRRRALVDYGYWYLPPPRTDADQARFYAAEVPVQALEMLLCLVTSRPFHFSADNPGADGGAARATFEAHVRERFAELVAPNGVTKARTVAVLEAYAPAWRERVAAVHAGREGAPP